ncbi:hypothetical protein F0170_25070 [Pseudomonas sp. MAFF 730085]|uniref:Uncharacterized protein n=1 Tax=Pseudomonas kitaguniensis TaxID=2607908 RepID=A0A5N7JZZ2_9PSED|nr:hypothetical protein [Pseudomonas kitaguniensis]MPR05199.1 hypothetical protein [Pseudomonas kitaguniensis]
MRRKSKERGPQRQAKACTSTQIQNVGAGLPAMQAPRCFSYTAVIQSQPSQPPHTRLANQISPNSSLGMNA